MGEVSLLLLLYVDMWVSVRSHHHEQEEGETDCWMMLGREDGQGEGHGKDMGPAMMALVLSLLGR